MPPGSRVAFVPLQDWASNRVLWAAYLLPRYDVDGANDLANLARTDFVVVQRARINDPRLEFITALPGGAVYRVRR